MQYDELSSVFQALANPIRLEILDMLSCGELCACTLLSHFSITQPTLSHDMHLLKETGLVRERVEGRKHYYAVNGPYIRDIQQAFKDLTMDKADCICRR